MANETVSVSGPIRIESDSKYKVAYDLAVKISNLEDVKKDRNYWLTLYWQAVRASSEGKTLESILQVQ